MKIITSLLFCLFVCGCEIEEKIDNAASKCENKIVQLLETVEEACLTKEEILLLIRASNEIDTGSTSYCPEDTTSEIQQ